jgi:LPS-assembly lipoprotein
MYAQNDAGADVAAYYSDIFIDNLPDRDGQHLKNALIDRIYTDGRPTSGARYILRIPDFKKDIVNMGIRKDATYTRAEMRFTGTLQLVDSGTGKPVLERHLRAVGGYNLLDNQFATMVSEESVAQNLLDEYADSIVTEINLHFRR